VIFAPESRVPKLVHIVKCRENIRLPRSSTDVERDKVLLRMLKTPPEPRAAKDAEKVLRPKPEQPKKPPRKT
jgi:hypothetical protein